MRNSLVIICIIVIELAFASPYAGAGLPIAPTRYEASFTATGASGEFAPYFFASNTYGSISQSWNGLASVAVGRSLDPRETLCIGYGAALMAGCSSPVDYERYDATSDNWQMHSLRPSNLYVREFYAEIKYRGISVCGGMKEGESRLLDGNLSSGDLVYGRNARPIPALKAGFFGFQDIPFTDGWLQIDGEVSYGRFADDGWWRKHYNYYNYHLASDVWLAYRRVYFRTDSQRRLSVTFGAQCATQFGGSTLAYSGGILVSRQKRGASINDFLKAFLPISNGSEDFRIGNTLGSWDMKALYAFDGCKVGAYFQWPWEDGSGMAKRNGFDGLWGLEVRMSPLAVVSGVVVEYLDLTNQSGPVHWAPGYVPGTSLTDVATGADDYYNNAVYNSYANYGMIIGSPMVMSPIYNTDGYPAVIYNRMRGFHVGIEGRLNSVVSYRSLFNHRKAWGSGYIPLLEPVGSTSFMLETMVDVKCCDGLRLKCAVSVDRGDMPGNSTGMLLSVAYIGNLNKLRR